MIGFYYQVGKALDIIFYAGSLRPGGGLTVAKIMIEAMAEDKSNSIVVYTGAKDASQALADLFERYENVREKEFFQNNNSEIRYIFSKLYFLPMSLLNRKRLVISINYYIPVFCKLFVYHLNLLSFMRQEGDKLSKKVKEFDAKLACKFADINVFESQYLKDTAEKYTRINIRNPKVLYIGVDPDFHAHSGKTTKELNANILLVSSMQPHKDNETCIRALAKLVEINPEVPWLLNIAGGQTKEQWQPLLAFSNTLGVSDHVRILGPLEKTKLSKLMSESLCLISASKVESFCMVALEAMASMCPAIVTKETSMPESVGNAAIVVDERSADQFASAIHELYHNKDSRQNLVEKGISHAKKFSNENFSRSLTEILEND